MNEDRFLLEGIDLERPNAARIYDWALGGTANWAIDREFGEQALRRFPMVRTIAQLNRAFLGRAVRYATSCGITQFLDIGSGVPTVGNVHEVADAADGDSRCVYVDSEPVAVAHSRMLLEEHGDRHRHAVLHGDMRDVDDVWARALATGVLDPGKPIGLLMVAMLHFVPPKLDAHAAVAEYRELLPPGSCLILSHVTESGVPEAELEHLRPLVRQYDQSSTPASFRSHEEIAGFFGDFALAEPGLVPIPDWVHEGDEPEPVTGLVPGSQMSCVLGGLGHKAP
ncbi:SAM-dependent methyltransferase [Amycolatopsis antarctica]|uniref:SAM-dependent methyltransferase n=1 Tax=Amycolatopsis antarctica TaxID=1854586 RepID=UPI0026CA2B58